MLAILKDSACLLSVSFSWMDCAPLCSSVGGAGPWAGVAGAACESPGAGAAGAACESSRAGAAGAACESPGAGGVSAGHLGGEGWCCAGQWAGWFVVCFLCPLGRGGVEETERCLGVGGAGGCLGSVAKAHPSLSSGLTPVRSRGSPAM